MSLHNGSTMQTCALNCPPSHFYSAFQAWVRQKLELNAQGERKAIEQSLTQSSAALGVTRDNLMRYETQREIYNDEVAALFAGGTHFESVVTFSLHN